MSFETISERAHAIWESEGRPTGKDVEHWLRAERELQAEAAPRRRSTDLQTKPAPSTSGASATARAQRGEPLSVAGPRDRSPKQENL